MAVVAHLPLIQVSCNEDTSASDLLGRFLIKGGDTVWQDGPVTRAVRLGAMLYLDEVAEAREDVVVLLHSLADHRRELFVDRTNETLKAPSQFQLVASYNPGYQRGMKELKPSTRQRFVGLSFGYPPSEVEAEIIQMESGAPDSICNKLVALARQIRSLKDLDLPETVSTRLLVHAAKLIVSGLPPRMACGAAIAEPLTDQREILAALRDLIALSV
jgi:nitric oxide reductase NorQ protein